jgi:hypothetical protein
MLCVTCKPLMVSVVILDVVMLSVVAPLFGPFKIFSSSFEILILGFVPGVGIHKPSYEQLKIFISVIYYPIVRIITTRELNNFDYLFLVRSYVTTGL